MPAKKPRTNKRMSDDSVKAATGRAWKEWFAILDKTGAKKMAHSDISKHLHEKCKVGPWWCQMVAVEYERERGLRQMFQKCDGEFAASGNRTLPVPVPTLYAAWVDEKRRKQWLGEADMEISTKTENKSLRAAWDGNRSRISVNFYPKGAEKTQVSVDHMKLASAKESAKMKSYWFEALNRLQNLLQA
jgi:hypothetical protein